MSNIELTTAELLQLSRWNTPTIYNGWEAITSRSSIDPVFNLEECVDYMPHLGAMVGYAVTVVVEPSNPDHPKKNADAWAEYREYLKSVPGPKVVVVQDMDKPFTYGAFWGEVNSNVHRALGCVGSVIDGAIRDVDEMTRAGFKAIARRLCVGHAYSYPVKWNVPVEVFGCPVEPGQLIHGDKHGFMAIPDEDVSALLGASVFMDDNEMSSLVPAAKQAQWYGDNGFLEAFREVEKRFVKAAREHFGRTGEF
ncbi:MAG: RraA family protein [Spirochaetota bacterium]